MSIREIGRQAFDYLISIICLIILSPVILILAFAIKVSSNGPVVFSQERIGKSGKAFTLYKFRSMYHGSEDGIPLLAGKKDPRITPVGRFMRKHKFDEIPNFINVLKGDMSIVGPRPEQLHFIREVILTTPEYNLVHEVKPGITSWGIVKYGYASNPGEMIKRLDYDLEYLENRSFMFDLKIIFHTIGIIIKGLGV